MCPALELCTAPRGGANEIDAGQCRDAGYQRVRNGCLKHRDGHSRDVVDPEVPQGLLVVIGDWMFVEDLHTGVELGRIGYGKSGVRNPRRVSDKGAHCGSVELCAQEGDPELVQDPSSRCFDSANVVRIRRAIELTSVQREVHDHALSDGRPRLPLTDEVQVRGIALLRSLSAQRGDDTSAEKADREERRARVRSHIARGFGTLRPN